MPTAPGPTAVSCSYISGDDCWVTGDFVVSVTAATGSPAVAGYRICRSNDVAPGAFAGCDVDLVLPAGSGGTSFTVAGANLPVDAMRRAYYFAAKDSAGEWGPWNTPRNVRLDRHNPTVSASGASPEWVSQAAPFITASDFGGGFYGGSGIADVRYRWNTPLDAGCTAGTAVGATPSLTAPEGDNVLYLCVRDRAGRVGSWSGQYRIDFTVPTAPGPTAVACTYANGDDCWVAGDFLASVTPATDPAGIAGYRICRSNDAAPGAFAGCDVDLVLPAGSGHASFTVAGANLPGNAMRRAYYFAAKDNAGVWGPWNSPRYVRVDRHNPTISASGASPEWVSYATANILAMDAGGGLYGGSGIADLRYRWNTPLDASCTAGTALGTTIFLTPPPGDNMLYLCARDRVGRVGSWSGQYRIDFTAPTAPGPTTVACAFTNGEDCWVGGDFTATVIPSTDPAGIAGYRICRSNDVAPAAFAGCDVDLVLPAGSGGVSFTVAGSNLPSDAMRRAYYFAAKDNASVFGPWNTPRYVRVDRRDPRVSASGASAQWVPSSTAVLSADDGEGGAAANSGLVEARWAWNTALDAACTSGTAYTSGATLSAPAGDNILYLCGRDRVGRVGRWSGQYRIGTNPNQPPQLFVYSGSTTGTPLLHNGTVAWGNVALNGGTRVAKMLWVQNGAPAGGGSLILEHAPANIELVPMQGNAFTIVGSLASPLASQAKDSFEVRLSAAQAGSFETLLKIWHNDPLRPNPLILHLTATVGVSAPVISGMVPSIIDRGQITTVRLSGSNFQGATFGLPADPAHPEQVVPTVTATSINSAGTELTATIDARAAGVDGVYIAAVTTNCENCVAATNLRVAPADTPVVDMYTPAEVAPGRIFPVVLTGANLRGAILTTSHPDVRVLDVDNSDDEILSGILLVPIGINPQGGFHIEAHTPNNPVVGVPVSFVVGEGSKHNFPVVSEEKLAKARAAGADLPGVYLQEPTLTAAMLERLQSGQVPPEQAISCLFSFVQRLFSSTRVYVVPLDAVGNVDPRVLEAIGLGELVKFGALTVTFFADVRIQFTFDHCYYTAFAGCLSGIFATEVVGLGGVATSFSYCIPYGGVTTSAGTTGGSLDSFELSSPGSCTTVTQLTPPTEGGIDFVNGSRGAHYATVEATGCCNEKIQAEVRLSTFTEFPFFALNNVIASGPVLEVSPNPEDCQEPEPELMLFLDANRDNNFAAAASPVALAALTDIDRYIPCTNPDDNEPIDVGQSQTMSLVAAYVQRSGDTVSIVAPPSGVTSVTFSIDDNLTSHFDGSAMNYPPAGKVPYEADYLLGSGGAGPAAFDSNHVATAELICRDYGGFTEVKATPNLASKPARSLAIPTPQEGEHERPLPKAGWVVSGSNKVVTTLDREALDDEDGTPFATTAGGGSGFATGDGLTTFGEYRGFVVKNKLVRLDPDKKDVFVSNRLPQGLGSFYIAQLGLEIHEIETTEYYEGESRQIDFRGGLMGSGQSVLVFREEQGPIIPDNGAWTHDAGITIGSLGVQGHSPDSTIFTNVVEAMPTNASNIQFTAKFFYDWTASHEFGHAVDICHRQENEQGLAVDRFGNVITVCEDGASLLPRAQMPQKVTVMHSGNAIKLFGVYNGNHSAFSGFHDQSKIQIRIKPSPSVP